MPLDTTPLLGSSSGEQAPPRGDSHPITQRACHSPWRAINQRLLFFIRAVLTAYLTSVAGVALKYKLESEDDHTGWRIPFQFSTIAFVLQWAYNLVTLVWTGMHAFEPNVPEPQENCSGSAFRARLAEFFSPPQELSGIERLSFSVFYVVCHVFALMNTLLYWAVLVPAGHGGFKFPDLPHHHHSPDNDTTVFYDPNKGLFEEDDIKSFSILNISTITTLIAFIEIGFLNSIRRPTPVTGHVFSTMVATGLYIAWAGLGRLATDHWGLFFLDPKLMDNSTWAAIASGAAFTLASPFVFTYVYGLIAMRESLTAAH